MAPRSSHFRRGRARTSTALAAAVLGLGILLVPTPTHAAPKGFFGVAPALVPQPAEYGTMAQAGVGTMRFLVSWPAIQPNAGGPIDWSTIDAQVAGATSAGITPLPFFYGTPVWAADCSGIQADLCTRASPVKTAAGRDGWFSLLAQAVARYGPNGSFWSNPSDAFNPPFAPIRVWQIGNEANTFIFAPPRPSVSDYYQLLKLSRAALRSGDPGAELMLGGLFGLPSKPGIKLDRFLDKLYAKKGAKRLFDAIAVHPYAPTLKKMMSQLDDAREAARRNKDGAPLVITELGWGSASSATAPPGFGKLLRGPSGQAKILRKAFRALSKERKRIKLRGVVWFSWRDAPPGAGGRCYLCESAGLLDNSGNAKPALSAYARAAN